MDHNTGNRSDEDVKIRVPISRIRSSNNFDPSITKEVIVKVFLNLFDVDFLFFYFYFI